VNMEEIDPALGAERETPPTGNPDDRLMKESADENPSSSPEQGYEAEADQERETGERTGQDHQEEAIVIADAVTTQAQGVEPDALLKAVIEAAIYITDVPLTAEQIAAAVQQPPERVREILGKLVVEYAAPDRGLSIRELAGGYKMSTKAEHHESIRRFVNKLQPALKLSLAALETLAVVAYKQPITGPEILDIRGVQGAGVVKTLLDRKLIAAAGRKNVIGKPILYKTTREFLIQFGLNSLAELPTLKEFEELGRFALTEGEEAALMDAAASPSGVRPNNPADVTDAADLTETLINTDETSSAEASTPPADGPQEQDA